MAEALETRVPPKLLVAAIDFGTTYTGVGFSMKDSYKTDPKKVWTKHWGRTGGGPALVSEKTPTCLLLTPEKDFHAFGYDAEDKYCELSQENQHIGWYYFKNFKMTLYHEKINRLTKIYSDQKLEMSALDVFKHSIAFIRREILKELDKLDLLNTTLKTEPNKILENEIGWVLTVPAIWDFTAKQFMREAAKRAGIPTEQLTLALEPEAASVFVKEMNIEREISDDEVSLAPYDPGTKYMVLDLGGDTVDVTVREVLPDRTLKEINKDSGGAWGGLRVHEEIFKYLEEIFTAELLNRLQTESTADYLELERNVEMVKGKMKADSKGRLTLPIPMELRDMLEKKNGSSLTDIFPKLQLSSPVEMIKDKLKINPQMIGKFYSPSVESIIQHCRTVFASPHGRDITDIIMVGGFAESKIMQSSVRKAFPDRSIIVPQEAGLIVLKGAVIYGHCPRIVSYRIASKTIGVRNLRFFLGESDPEEKKEIINGVPYCKDIFHKLCEADAEFMIGETVTHEVYPVRPDMTEMTLNLFQTDDKNPIYTTDAGCTEIGNIKVEMPNISKGMERQVDVSLIFGDTELIVEGLDTETGKSIRVHLDLLHH